MKRRKKAWKESSARKLFREKLLNGALDDKNVEIEAADMPIGVEIMGPSGMEEMTGQIQSMIASLGSSRKKKKKMKVKKAFKQLWDEEAAMMINEEEIRAIALKNVEQHGIVS